MADGLNVRIFGIGALEREMLVIDRNVRRATMWTVREAGRKVKQQAKRNVPVKTGALKRSIHSSKRLIGSGTTFAVRVAPRGLLYSGKIEARAHYMAGAYDTVTPQLAAIATVAWARATRGRR